MALDVYYPADIRNALLAVEQAISATADAFGQPGDADGSQSADASPSAFSAGFMTGYRATLTTMALLFGLVNRPETSWPERKAGSLATAPLFPRQR
jgi:hypothetical protein